ncbi:cyclase family protein [Thermodesulfobacteriota bacterium]
MKIIDISVPVSPGLSVWPGDSPVVLERYRALSAGDDCNASRICCSVHTGTHVDAPGHFIDNALTVEDLSLDTLIGPALVIEVPAAGAIEPAFLESVLLPHGIVRLLFKTRNSDLWRKPDHSFHSDYVALSPKAAAWIVNRGIRLVGVDYLSVQMFADSEPLTHRTLLKAGVVIVEGLDLQTVHPGSYQLICLPLKLVGSDGAPARAVLIEG